MSATSIKLPLFPLDVVLFPGTVLPLYIFEPRYRQMIQDCLDEDQPFGVVLVKAGGTFMDEATYPVGTLAEIHNLQRLEDGCYNLMGVGTKRFRIISRSLDKPYISGSLELFDEDFETEDQLTGLAQQAKNLFSTYLDMLLRAASEQEVHANLPEAPEELSYFVAYFLEIENSKKQQMLEMTSTRQRLEEEVTVLRREVPFLRQLLSRKLSDDITRLN
jgi:Lon protease-like protein